MGFTNVVRVFIALVLISTVCSPVRGQFMQPNYYQNGCPDAVPTISRVVANAIRNDVRAGPGVLRIFFHDCFVEGCDGSVLIDPANNGGDSEKNATANLTLQNYVVIEDAKAAVENICPETVSCADVLAYAAATAVAVLGGPVVEIQGGRLDGFVSSSAAANQSLPSPLFSLSQLQTLFNSKGLNSNDLVVLAGAHTIGKSHCGAFSNRLYTNTGAASEDPTLNSNFAGSLYQQCPNATANILVNNDVQTPNTFDNKYYQNVVDGKALFTSDEQLYTSSQTSSYVNNYGANNGDFFRDFGHSLIKMGKIGVKTGSSGNIRKICNAFN